VAQGMAVHLIALGVLAWTADRIHDGTTAPWLFVLATTGALLQGCVFAAIGACVGCLAPTTLAIALVLGSVLGSRWIGSATFLQSATSTVWATLIPDPSRLDLAREVGFGRPISMSSTALAWAAGALQVSALALLASLCLRRDRT
jgi:hypothetical protein